MIIEQKAKLRMLLSTMFDTVDEQLANALNAALDGDSELAVEVHKNDDKVDALEMEVDRHCTEMLQTGELSDADVRMVVTAIKMNTDLERVGDHCKNIAKESVELSSHLDTVPKEQFLSIAEAVRKKLYLAQDAFLEEDNNLAREITTREDNVDTLYRSILKSAGEAAKANSQDPELFAKIVSMGKSMDRIADHATNIAELVVYWLDNEDIRHPKLKRVN